MIPTTTPSGMMSWTSGCTTIRASSSSRWRSSTSRAFYTTTISMINHSRPHASALPDKTLNDSETLDIPKTLNLCPGRLYERDNIRLSRPYLVRHQGTSGIGLWSSAHCGSGGGKPASMVRGTMFLEVGYEGERSMFCGGECNFCKFKLFTRGVAFVSQDDGRA